VSALLQALLESASSGLTWLAVVTLGVAACFVLYIGLALGVALFHPNAQVRRHATYVLRQLLDAFVQLVRRRGQ
jgi:hypothetical protein